MNSYVARYVLWEMRSPIPSPGQKSVTSLLFILNAAAISEPMKPAR